MKSLISNIFAVSLIFVLYGYGQVYNVDDFGAVGDGITDDKAAIQSALDELRDNGGELLFTSGKVYNMKSGLDLNNFTDSYDYLISSSGDEKATVKLDDSVPISSTYIGFRVTNSRNITFSNLCFDGNRDGRGVTSANSSHLIHIGTNCNKIRLYDMLLINSVMDNLYVRPDERYESDIMTDFEMYNCVLDNAFRDNMSIIRGKNFKIIGCEFSNANGTAPEAGIDMEPNRRDDYSDLGYGNMLIEGCTFKNNDRFGLMLTKTAPICGTSTIRNNTFDNNGLLIGSVDNLVENNIFKNIDHPTELDGMPEGPMRWGMIYFTGGSVGVTVNNIIRNNYFYDNPFYENAKQYAICFMKSYQQTDNVVANNYSYNNNIDGIVGIWTGGDANIDDGTVEAIEDDDSNTDGVFGNVYLTRKEIGYWNMDLDFISETSISDLSDFNQTGVLHNNPTIVGGKINEALDFSSDNKYIEIPIEKNLNVVMNLTISAWVNWNGSNSESEQVIVGRNEDWRLNINNSGEVGFYAPQTNDSSYNAGWTRTSESIPAGEWKFVAITYDGKVTKIYIDGEEKASEKGYGRLDTSSSVIYIASKIDDEMSFNGSIDDVRLYNCSLSEDEINDLYKTGNINDKAAPEGSGTKVDPYQIASIQNLSWLAQNSDKWDAYYIQTANIDMAKSATWDDADDDSDGDKYNDVNDRLANGNNEGWYPLGNLNGSEKFTGHYDGCGFTINGISITNRSTSGNGFFGEITGGKVENLGLTNVDIRGNDIVGSIAASCSGDSIIKSFITGTITCVDGGTAGTQFGGLVGSIGSGSTISECYSEVNIEGKGVNIEKVGGFVGSISSSAVISKSYSLGDLDSVGITAGGFAGEVSGTPIIEHCYSAGLVDNSVTDQGFIGVVGDGTPVFTSNFFDKESSGHTSSVGASAKTTDEMIMESTFSNAGWDFTNSWESITNYPNLKQNSNPRLEVGIDYKEITPPEGSGTESDPFKIASLENLSWLSQIDSVWSCFFVQTANIDASQTATWDDSDDNNDGNKYNDPNDLTSEGTNDGFSPIGGSAVKFEGFYNGDDYEIDKLTINRSNSKYVGFFGSIGNPYNIVNEIKNLGLTNINVSGKGIAGGLVGENYGVKISNSFAHGNVSSSSSDGYIGGLIGSNNLAEAEISKCFTDVHVVSSGSGQYIGGFVGRNRTEAVISKCYSKGTVESAGNKVGGFIGQMASAAVENCYSSASVSSGGSGTSIGGFCGAIYSADIENCYSVGANNSFNTKGFLGSKGGLSNVLSGNYLDTLASGCNQNAVAEAASGKTTAEMQDASTYVGWDFTNIWSIEANSYPSLSGVKVSVEDNHTEKIATEFELSQNYPNPFNPTTVIHFSIPKQSNVKLSVYNLLGEKVAELVNGDFSAGNYEVNFNASNLASGMYIYRISAGSYIAVKKMLLLK